MCGLLYFWGITISVVTFVNLIIAVGLAVDYAAHIAHTFMRISAIDKNGQPLGEL